MLSFVNMSPKITYFMVKNTKKQTRNLKTSKNTGIAKIIKNGPSGNRTRVFGFEAQKDILYPMGPHRVIK